MIKNTLFLAGFIALICSGCSTAGPYVTNISSNGDGTITVEKSAVSYNMMTGTVSQGEKSNSQIIRVCPDPSAHAAK